MAKKKRWSDKRRRRSEYRAEKRARRYGYSNSYVNEEYRSKVVDSENQEDEDLSETKDSESPNYSSQECASIYKTLETRLQDIEAYMTSKQFRLHCEISRI